MRKTLLVAFAAITAASTVVPAAAANPAAPVAPKPVSKVKWGKCPDGPLYAKLECGKLRVPLDYQKPDGRKITLAVSRLPSTKPEKRRGVLMVNPGGPGVEALSYPAVLTLPVLPAPLPASVRQQYDVIGFDPRGVGRSNPVTCDLLPEQLKDGNLSYPKNSADVRERAKLARTQAEQCATSKTSWMLPHMTTANTARDMDRLRAALGESKTSYLGASYGSYLGAVYTTMFPRRSDRVVLDSNLGPRGYDITALRALGRGLEDRFPDFAKFAAANPKYGLGRTPIQVRAKFHELANRLERTPIGAYNGSLFRALTFNSLYGYSKKDLATLAKTWQSLDNGKEPPPGPALPFSENAFAARFHVICNDSTWPRSVLRYQVDVAIDRIRHPLIGAAAANISACAYWPKEGVEPPVRVGDRGPSNVLMVQNERDPGTPLSGARKLRAALGDRARMVTADQGGHGVYVVAGNKCANNAVTDYLSTGKRPARDTFCAAEPE